MAVIRGMLRRRCRPVLVDLAWVPISWIRPHRSRSDAPFHRFDLIASDIDGGGRSPAGTAATRPAPMRDAGHRGGERLTSRKTLGSRTRAQGRRVAAGHRRAGRGLHRAVGRSPEFREPVDLATLLSSFGILAALSGKAMLPRRLCAGKRVALEHHRDLAGSGQVIDDPLADQDLAGWLLQPAEHPEQVVFHGRPAAPGNCHPTCARRSRSRHHPVKCFVSFRV